MTTQIAQSQTVVTLTITELETLLRRIVREEVSRALHAPAPNIADDWSQEGPDDPEGDAILLAEALEIIERRKTHPEKRRRWEDIKAELKQAEEAGEISA